MNALRTAIENIKPQIKLEDGFVYRGPNDHGYFSGNLTEGVVARLRLDWEEEHAKNYTDEERLDAALSFLEEDLQDLIVNGDAEDYSDHLLKVINGEKKLGKSAVEVDIFALNAHAQRLTRKESTEWTVYLLMWVKFE